MDELEFYNNRYFRLNKILLMMLGLWPYQSAPVKFAIKFFYFMTYMVSITPQLISLKQYLGVNPDRAIQAIGSGMFFLGCFLKLLTAIVNETKLKTLCKNMAANFKLLNNQMETDLLLRHSAIGRYLTIGNVVYMYTSLVAFIMIPLVPVIMDYVIPVNESRIRLFILNGEYGVDRLENFGKIYALEALSCIATVVTFVPFDTTCVVCVEQCVGLLSVVKLRLQLATTRLNTDGNLMYEDDNSYQAMIDCIELHKKALHFGEILEASYSMYFLIILGTNIISLSSISVVLLMNLQRPAEVFRFLLIIMGLFIHLFYLSWPGQKIIDLSSQLHENTYMNEWYNCSKRTRKLLMFMMLKVKDPFVLTAGGLYILNLANFGTFVRVTLSYITVFSSFRDES